jgi:very-short-patch-repair endonuclease/predicted transcriptional regulator of viral defense system
MGRESRRTKFADVWRLAERQHGVITRRQLLSAGLSSDAIDSRVGAGRLHRIWRGIYAVGRPQLTWHGWSMGAVLACGPSSLLSHDSAAALWGIRAMKREQEKEGRRPREIHISVPGSATRVRAGIRVHRRSTLKRSDRTSRDGISVTSPARTLIDLATELTGSELEIAVNKADKLGLIDPESLRSAVDQHLRCSGVALLRRILDRRTFRLTDSELERRFLRLADWAGLPRPLTQQRVNGFRVDFFWPELGLVVETDGLRYHRTAAQQAKDRVRDQTHIAAGLTPLRFTHAQIAYRPAQVADILRPVAERCRARIVEFPGESAGKSTKQA